VLAGTQNWFPKLNKEWSGPGYKAGKKKRMEKVSYQTVNCDFDRISV
jgi:hypothetical protein